MRSTARLYSLTVNYIIDERRDPLVSAHAAARLLKDNYRRLQAWPLALTAYNHGPNSIARAVKETGTRDLSTIIEKYRGRRFGFASKNFYASFVAASEIALNYQKYFGDIATPTPINFLSFETPKEVSAKSLAQAFGISAEEFRKFNPAFRLQAFRTYLKVPRGTRINLPPEHLASLKKGVEIVAAISEKELNIPSRKSHKVGKSENLYLISKLYGTSLTDIIALNNISDPSRIYPGMHLKIPQKDANSSAKEAIASSTVSPVQEELERIFLPFEKRPAPIPNTEFFSKLLALENGEEANRIPFSKSSQFAMEEDLFKSYNLEAKRLGPNLYQITVNMNETIGHFSDWAIIRIRNIASFNRAPFHKIRSLRVGQKLNLPIVDSKIKEFNLKRVQYHQAIEEDFFERYEVVDTFSHMVRRGEVVHQIAKNYDVPLWLLAKFAPEKIHGALRVGENLTIPQLREKAEFGEI